MWLLDTNSIYLMNNILVYLLSFKILITITIKVIRKINIIILQFLYYLQYWKYIFDEKKNYCKYYLPITINFINYIIIVHIGIVTG